MRGITKAALLGVLLVFLLVGGCAKEVSQVVAEVNGTELTKKQLDLKVGQVKSMFEMQGFQFQGEEGAEMLTLLERETLKQLIMETILREEAEKQGISVTPEEVQENLDRIIEPYGEETFKEIMKQQNMTEEQLKSDIQLMLVRDRLFDKVTAEVSISDSQIQDYYQAHKEDLIQYRASHILIMPDGSAEDQEAADQEAKAKAVALIEELHQGADFAELAADNSGDGTAATGGDLGQFFTKTESPYVPEFTEAAVGLAVGEYSQEPVKTMFGYHIIKITAKKETLQELKADIKARLESTEKNKLFDEYFSKAMAEATVINHLEPEDAETDKQSEVKE